MILLIVTGLALIGLIVGAVLKIKQKILILGACVILLVLCNLTNELAAVNVSNHHQINYPIKDKHHPIQEVPPTTLGVLSNETA